MLHDLHAHTVGFAVVPLTIRENTVGALLFGFAASRTYSPQERDFILGIYEKIILPLSSGD